MLEKNQIIIFPHPRKLFVFFLHRYTYLDHLVLKNFFKVLFSESKISLQSQIVHLCYTVLPSLNPCFPKKHLTPFLLLLELVLLLAVLFVIVGDVGVGRLVVMSIVRRRWFPGAVQPGEFGGADFLRARGAGHAPGVLGPALLCGAATGGQEALGHGCFGLITPLIHTSPLHHTCSGQKYKILT